jgi:hypothetical protein
MGLNKKQSLNVDLRVLGFWEVKSDLASIAF